MTQIKAPWTFEQVDALWAWQACGHVHPFTCINRDDHPVIDGDKGVLVPTSNGWLCPYCGYTQDWAHDFMLKGPPPIPMLGGDA